MVQAPAYRAVLFDWRGTLVHDPPHEWWVARALERAGRAPEPLEVARFSDALRVAGDLPEVRAGEATCDCSLELHRAWSFDFFARAGLDDELATALYDLDFDPDAHPFYPDVLPALRALHERGCAIALVSDIHVDLRPEFVAAGLDDYIDAYVLSFEHGVQKPDPRIFEITLDLLGVAAADAVMVGDRASHDGASVKAGIAAWLVPPLASATDTRGLDRLVALVG
jgi:HAD superfamily hydrolase (TIGR01509 family)